MLWPLYKTRFLLVLLLLIGVMAQGKSIQFSGKECLSSSFEAHIKHSGRFFGIMTNELKVTKRGCEVKIFFKDILETTWKIDVCREPIHLKVESKGSLDVYKRRHTCLGADTSDYCKSWEEVASILQDHGLVFAKGHREDLKSAHGQIYCTYLLLENYLEKGTLFSAYQEKVYLFNSPKVRQMGKFKSSKNSSEKKF